MKITIILAALTLLAGITGCKENDIALYSESPRLELNSLVTCTFDDADYMKAYIADQKSPAVSFDAESQLIGYMLKEPRTYCLTVSPGNLSAFPVEVSVANPYTFPVSVSRVSSTVHVACPAKAYASTRKKQLQGLSVLGFDRENDAHQFSPGRVENLTCRLRVVLQIYPQDWSNAQWGVYSTAKYFLMMETFKAIHSEIPRTQEAQLQIRTAYNKYKQEYGPLYGDDDESEEEINFPLNN